MLEALLLELVLLCSRVELDNEYCRESSDISLDSVLGTAPCSNVDSGWTN
jgi:hypothetical protein